MKVMLLELVSRLVGTHQLILLNYYPYIARWGGTPMKKIVLKKVVFSMLKNIFKCPPGSWRPTRGR